MKIEIHIRETKPDGRRVGKRNAYVESCRVYNEAGDGLRLGNMSMIAFEFFNLHAKRLTKAWREAVTTEDFTKAIGLEEFLEMTKGRGKKNV